LRLDTFRDDVGFRTQGAIVALVRGLRGHGRDFDVLLLLYDPNASEIGVRLLMHNTIKYGPHQRSHLDDDQFIVAAAMVMNSVELKLLLAKLEGLRFEAQNQCEENGKLQNSGVPLDPVQIHQQWELTRKRKRQMRWIRRRLLELEEVAAYKTPPEEKKLRRKEFYEAFFDVVKKVMPYADFNDFCKEAAELAGQDWLDDEKRA
jgi:hypothetical protein